MKSPCASIIMIQSSSPKQQDSREDYFVDIDRMVNEGLGGERNRGLRPFIVLAIKFKPLRIDRQRGEETPIPF
jgi:hypothetical protein